MTSEQKEQLKDWVDTWKNAGKELEKIRKEEIRNADTEKAIRSLDKAFKSAVLLNPPKPYSGLVDMQKIFKKIKLC